LAWCAALLTVAATSCGRPAQSVEGSSFIDVHMVDVDHGWGTRLDDIVTTADAGRTWTATTMPVTDKGFTSTVFGDYPSASVAWLCQRGAVRGGGPQQAAGDYQFQRFPSSRCFVTTDTGATWSSLDIPGTAGGTVSKRDRTDADLVALSAIDGMSALGVVRSERIHAGGGQESYNLLSLSVVRTVDGGRTWSTVLQRSPSDGSPNSLGTPRIRLVGTTGWLVDFLPGVLQRTDDGGLTWQTVPLPPSLGVDWDTRTASLGTPSPPGRDAVGIPVITYASESRKRSLRLLISGDGGKTWRVTSSLPCRSSCTDFGAPDAYDWVVEDGDTLIVTHDGEHWRRADVPAPFSQLLSVHMLSERDGWAVGRGSADGGAVIGPTSTSRSELREPVRTSDGGLTWTPVER
jgi:hypothetical protein